MSGKYGGEHDGGGRYRGDAYQPTRDPIGAPACAPCAAADDLPPRGENGFLKATRREGWFSLALFAISLAACLSLTLGLLA